MDMVGVEDASSDGLGAVLDPLAGECGAKEVSLPVVRHARQKGVAISRNSGAEQAHTELLAFIDSDCVATPGWLRELVPVFEDGSIGAVGGMIRAYERHSTFGRYGDVCSSLFIGL